jgi:drug/metabolite transporter (DMT)-like permease
VVSELGPLTITGTRALLATPLLLLLARLSPGALPPFTRADYMAFALLSLTGLVGNTTLWFWGIQYTTASTAGILGASAPVVVAVAAALWLGDPLSRRNLAGIVVTVAAVLLVLSRGSPKVLMTFSFNRGDLIILASQVIWIAYTLFSRASATRLAPVTVQAGAHIVSCIILTPLALFERPWESLPRASWIALGVVLYGAVPVTLGHLWFYQAIRVVGAGPAATFMNLTPFLVIGFAWALGEPVRWYHLVGAMAVIAGVVLATSRR